MIYNTLFWRIDSCENRFTFFLLYFSGMNNKVVTIMQDESHQAFLCIKSYRSDMCYDKNVNAFIFTKIF